MVVQTIQLMKFFLQMAYGNSEDYYRGGGPGLPFQGVCQENGASPAIWLAMSIVLMNMVQSNGYQVLFSSPISHWVTDLLGLLYVNNCDLFAMDDDGCHPHLAIANLQCNINLRQGGLAVTRGSLLVKKSSWCLLAIHPQGHWWTCTLFAPFQPYLWYRTHCITLSPSNGSTPTKVSPWLG